jgi:hypothetical protein
MKNFYPFLMAAILAMALGCNEGTPGGPGVKKTGPSTSSTTTPSTTTPSPSTETASSPPYSTDTPRVTEKPPVTTAEPAPGTDANPIAGDPENSFRLDAPNLATTIKQGETKVVTIGISRAKNFDQDVALKLEGVPKGVTVDPADPMIKHGEKEVKLNVTAAEDAALNDFTIKVIGHPATGADATNEFKLSITKP